MPNVKVQGSKEIQRPNDPKSFNILSFVIHLTFEIRHLKLRSSDLFHMPEAGIVLEENGETVGVHLG
jgi:hypothetical protein